MPTDPRALANARLFDALAIDPSVIETNRSGSLTKHQRALCLLHALKVDVFATTFLLISTMIFWGWWVNRLPLLLMLIGTPIFLAVALYCFKIATAYLWDALEAVSCTAQGRPGRQILGGKTRSFLIVLGSRTFETSPQVLQALPESANCSVFFSKRATHLLSIEIRSLS